MKTAVLCFLLTCTLVHCADLFLGNPSPDKIFLIYETQAKYRAIPFIKREKDIFYNAPFHRIIAKIELLDNNPMSKSTATVTAGGIGQSYVNIRLTSERGRGLFYDISIYALTPTKAELMAQQSAFEYRNLSSSYW